MLKVEVVILMPEGETASRCAPAFRRRTSSTTPISPRRAGAGITISRPGAAPTRCPAAKRLFLPLRTGRGAVGVLGINREAPGPLFTPDERRLLDALADQAAVAIERTQLAEEHRRRRALLAETERLRSSLLTSISHDLRTPLASIIGTITSLRSFGELYDETTRDEMLATAQEEAERLNRFVANLLDMTRLDSGAIEPKREMIDVGDIVGAALQRAGKVLAGHRVTVDSARPTCRCCRSTFVLLEQVLFNLLDNAAKYRAGAASRSRSPGAARMASVVIEVRDEGPGHPARRARTHLRQVLPRPAAATGSAPAPGWASRSAAASSRRMGGTIAARNRGDRSGAVFTIRFPSTELPQPASGPRWRPMAGNAPSS